MNPNTPPDPKTNLSWNTHTHLYIYIFFFLSFLLLWTIKHRYTLHLSNDPKPNLATSDIKNHLFFQPVLRCQKQGGEEIGVGGMQCPEEKGRRGDSSQLSSFTGGGPQERTSSTDFRALHYGELTLARVDRVSGLWQARQFHSPAHTLLRTR